MSMFKTVYLVDVGILLTSDNEEFESYNVAYDHKYGYYDENQFYMVDKNKAIDFVNNYVNDGIDMTYGIISKTELPYEITDEEIDDGEVNVEGETYELNDVIYSTAKLNGKIEDNFIRV
ncbi:MAG: hypothetical protein VZS44_09965 [Bacilli bacterium]|nr:hypothetical protein [Bacilli bacterium]